MVVQKAHLFFKNLCFFLLFFKIKYFFTKYSGVVSLNSGNM